MVPADSIDDDARRHVAHVMLEHARELLERVGYFTAVGDVVNTASRLQDHAAAGEVLLSARLAQLLPTSVGVPEQVVLKGKQEPFDVRRVQWFGDRP